jgi:hypothetical protein
MQISTVISFGRRQTHITYSHAAGSKTLSLGLSSSMSTVIFAEHYSMSDSDLLCPARTIVPCSLKYAFPLEWSMCCRMPAAGATCKFITWIYPRTSIPEVHLHSTLFTYFSFSISINVPVGIHPGSCRRILGGQSSTDTHRLSQGWPNLQSVSLLDIVVFRLHGCDGILLAKPSVSSAETGRAICRPGSKCLESCSTGEVTVGPSIGRFVA